MIERELKVEAEVLWSYRACHAGRYIGVDRQTQPLVS